MIDIISIVGDMISSNYWQFGYMQSKMVLRALLLREYQYNKFYCTININYVIIFINCYTLIGIIVLTTINYEFIDFIKANN